VKSAPFGLPPRPLGQADWLAAQSMLAEIAPDWSVELVGICTDEASLVILPEGGDDACGASFAISREAYGLRLDKVHWDEMTEVGVFASLADALDAIGASLYGWSGLWAPATVTLH